MSSSQSRSLSVFVYLVYADGGRLDKLSGLEGGRFRQCEVKVGVNSELLSSGTIVGGGFSILEAVAPEGLIVKNLG